MMLRRSFWKGAFLGGLFTSIGLSLGIVLVAFSAPTVPAANAVPAAARQPAPPVRKRAPEVTPSSHEAACLNCLKLTITQRNTAYPLGKNLLMLSVDSLAGGALLIHIGRESHLLQIGQYADLRHESGCRIALSESVRGRAELFFACDRMDELDDDLRDMTVALN